MKKEEFYKVYREASTNVNSVPCVDRKLNVHNKKLTTAKFTYFFWKSPLPFNVVMHEENRHFTSGQ